MKKESPLFTDLECFISTPEAIFIKNKRLSMGLGCAEFACLLGMKANGERTVRGWESGEHMPSTVTLTRIKTLSNCVPFKSNITSSFRFIDLFSGIGGIRLPFQELGGQCVFSSEWDKFAQRTYAANFGEIPHGDITLISETEIPDHDLLVAGFPCQAFSQAGLKQGFNDTRGTMFFEIQRILEEKRPKAFLLENVKQLKSHDKGRTLNTILNILRGQQTSQSPLSIQVGMELFNKTQQALASHLNYWVDIKVLRAADFGVPQNRERIFIVGFNLDYFGVTTPFDKWFTWPEPPKKPTCVGDILEHIRSPNIDLSEYTISDKLWVGHQRRKQQHRNKGNGFGYSLYQANDAYTNTLSARYYKDGSEILIDQSQFGKNPRRLTPRECARLQGFPENFVIDAVSKGQMYKQFGNSVSMPVIRALAKEIQHTLKYAEAMRTS